jgi:hypothetical protein
MRFKKPRWLQSPTDLIDSAVVATMRGYGTQRLIWSHDTDTVLDLQKLEEQPNQYTNRAVAIGSDGSVTFFVDGTEPTPDDATIWYSTSWLNSDALRKVSSHIVRQMGANMNVVVFKDGQDMTYYLEEFQ